MDADDRGAARQRVEDLHHRAIGWSMGWTEDARSGVREGLAIRLDPDVREELLGDAEITLDADTVMAIRRDRVTLDRTIHELADALRRNGH